MSNYERQFFEYFQILDRKRYAQPLVLGGITASGGGVGYPPGGYVGQLPQTEVCYDLSEDATLDTVPSGESLLDNLNHIRYRIHQLELISGAGGSGGGSTIIYDDGVLQGTATEFDFTSDLTATVSAGRVTVASTASGSNIRKIIKINVDDPDLYDEYDPTDAGLQSALDAIIYGDIIKIPSGYYNIDGFIDLTVGASLIGEGMESTVIYVTTEDTDAWAIDTNEFGVYPMLSIENIQFAIDSSYLFTSNDTIGGMARIRSTALKNVIINGYHYCNTSSTGCIFYGLYYENALTPDYGTSEFLNTIDNVYIDVSGDGNHLVSYQGVRADADSIRGIYCNIESNECADIIGGYINATDNGGIISGVKDSIFSAKRYDDYQLNNGIVKGLVLTSFIQNATTYPLTNVRVSAYNEPLDHLSNSYTYGLVTDCQFTIANSLIESMCYPTHFDDQIDKIHYNKSLLIDNTAGLGNIFIKNLDVLTKTRTWRPSTHTYLEQSYHIDVVNNPKLYFYDSSFTFIELEDEVVETYSPLWDIGSNGKLYNTVIDGVTYNYASSEFVDGAYFGDVQGGNYVSINQNGIRLYGTATDFEDLRIDGMQTRVGVVAPTDETGFRGDSNFYSRNFVHTQADEVQFTTQIPHGWKNESTIYPHVHFSPWVSGSGTQAGKFILEYYWANVNGLYPASPSTYPMECTWSGDGQWYHYIASGSGGIDATGKSLSSILKCRLYRDNTVTNNYANKLAFLYFDMHCEMDAFGSSSEYTK